VLDADIRGFFDAINHEYLVRLIEQKIGDPRVVRLIQKWLKAGVLEGETLTQAERGTPQGGCVSPVLANIYLHYAYDCWAKDWRKEKAKGDAIFVRYADDSIAGFQHKNEALRFLAELQIQLRKYDLELHPEKTRVLEFGRFASEDRARRGERKPETFDFLGFTHICGKSRAGQYQLQRRTARKRMTRKLGEIKVELRKRMHQKIPVVGKWLAAVVRGHLQYYGVPLNFRAISTFHHEVVRYWYRTLKRRSQKSNITWERMDRLSSRWLPKPRIVHPYPTERLVV
jgi:group II intron reverse transcriptase/maturase